MEEAVVTKLVREMRDFQTRIFLTTQEPASALIRAAVERDPRLLYYLRSFRSVRSYAGLMLEAAYIRQEVPQSEVYIGETLEECVDLMCQQVGAYKKTLNLVYPDPVDLGAVFQNFQEKHSSFYPNLTTMQAQSIQSLAGYNASPVQITYRIGQVKLGMMEQEVDQEVDRLTRLLFLPGMPKEAQIYLAHNYLASTVTYKDEHANHLQMSYTQSAYGALIKKQCVCQGYAEAFKRLMDAAGVPCLVIYGRCTGSDGTHAWNLVALNGEYYHIDVTWDGSGPRPGYLYFCRNDQYFTGKRVWSRKFNPACQGSRPVLAQARQYVARNREMLRRRGVPEVVLD